MYAHFTDVVYKSSISIWLSISFCYCRFHDFLFPSPSLNIKKTLPNLRKVNEQNCHQRIRTPIENGITSQRENVNLSGPTKQFHELRSRTLFVNGNLNIHSSRNTAIVTTLSPKTGMNHREMVVLWETCRVITAQEYLQAAVRNTVRAVLYISFRYLHNSWMIMYKTLRLWMLLLSVLEVHECFF